MSATFIKDNGTGYIKKLTFDISEADMQTLNTIPVKIYTADGLNTFLPIFASISGTPGAKPGTFTFNTLNLGDGATSWYAKIDLQQIAASNLQSSKAYVFSCGTYQNSADGGFNDPTRDTVLKANADDLTGTGDYTITVLYILIPKQ